MGVQAKENALFGTIHKDGLAEVYRLVVEKSSILGRMSHPIFDVSNPVESLSQIITAAALIQGRDTPRVEYAEPTDKFLETLCTTFVSTPKRAQDLLEWQPRHPSLTAGMEIYIRSFQANREKGENGMPIH